MVKKYPKFCIVLLMKATVLAVFPCAKDLAEPTSQRTIYSKLEEFDTVQESPSNLLVFLSSVPAH